LAGRLAPLKPKSWISKKEKSYPGDACKKTTSIITGTEYQVRTVTEKKKPEKVIGQVSNFLLRQLDNGNVVCMVYNSECNHVVG
jgi:hypothetical protein